MLLLGMKDNQFTQKDIQHVFEEIDLNGNGYIDFQEFLAWATKWTKPSRDLRDMKEVDADHAANDKDKLSADNAESKSH